MMNLKIKISDWEILKIKLRRKYNHLSEEDLMYSEGNEPKLVDKLAIRLKRSKDYVVYTIAKQLADLSSNRL